MEISGISRLQPPYQPPKNLPRGCVILWIAALGRRIEHTPAEMKYKQK